MQYAELWVERAIQAAKRCMKFKTTCHPERVIGGHELVKRALAAARYSNGITLLSMEELWEAHKKVKVATAVSGAYDPDKDQPNLHYMSDKGKPCKPDVWAVIQPMLTKYLQANMPESEEREADISHIQSANTSLLEVYMHDMVMLNAEWCLSSAGYGRPKKTQSYWAMVHYKTYSQPSRIKKYVRVVLPPNPVDGSSRQLKVALCDFWVRSAPLVIPHLAVSIHRMNYTTRPAISNYVVPLSAIIRPVIHTHQMDKGKMVFLFNGYDFQSGTKQ